MLGAGEISSPAAGGIDTTGYTRIECVSAGARSRLLRRTAVIVA